MEIKTIRSDEVYHKLLTAPQDKKNDIYRYELMAPFQKKWELIHVPMKAAVPGGYDVIMASSMLGFLEPEKVDDSQKENIEKISEEALWKVSGQTVSRSLQRFEEAGIELPVQEYTFSILLANAENPYIVLSEGYCGDGGIPGYIIVYLVPDEFTMKRLPAAVAHEVNHNVRFQKIAWRNDITLGEMMVSEGLAENFAVHLFGKECVGPWVTKTDLTELHEYVKPIIKEGLGVQGLENLNAYLYGDEIAKLQDYEPVGLPYCAGYACGYYLVKHYLEKTGMSIEEATVLPAEEILKESEDFWEEGYGK